MFEYTVKGGESVLTVWPERPTDFYDKEGSRMAARGNF